MTTEHQTKETVNIPAICALLREMDTTGAEVNLHNIAAMLERLDRENAELKALVTNRESTIEFLQESAAERERDIERAAHEPKTGLSSEEHQMIARLCDTSHEAVAAYERRFQIRGSLFGPIDNEMIALRDASARMIVAAINGGRKPPETNKLPTPDEGNGETVGRAIAETTRNTSNTVGSRHKPECAFHEAQADGMQHPSGACDCGATASE